MSGLHRTFGTNLTKETAGFEMEFPEATNDDGTVPTFVLARMGGGNIEFQKATERATRPYRRQMELGALKEDIAKKILLDVFVDSVLKGWRNVKNAEGGDLIYGRQAAIDLMNSVPDLYARLSEEARLAANFRDMEMETQAKN